MKKHYAILLLGVSCSGKSTIAQYLVENYNYKFAKTYTTRLPRSMEDQEYYFTTTHHFQQLIQENFFF